MSLFIFAFLIALTGLDDVESDAVHYLHVKIESDGSRCSGAVLGDIIVTSASCQSTHQGFKSSITYWLMSGGQKKVNMAETGGTSAYHPNYDPGSKKSLPKNDIAVIDPRVRAPNQGWVTRIGEVPTDRGVSIFMIKSNYTDPSDYEAVLVQIWANDKCEAYFERRRRFFNRTTMICGEGAAGNDIYPCRTDLGAPIFHYGEDNLRKLIGVYSHGPFAMTPPCLVKRRPLLFTRLKYFEPFINNPATFVGQGELEPEFSWYP